MPLQNLKDLSLPDLTKAIVATGEPAFRAKQIFKWLYQKRVESFDSMANISKPLRIKLAETFTLDKLPVAIVLESKDNDAVKFGFEAHGSEWIIESVLLVDGDRRTACLSSQLGCNLGCVFCETGTLGFVRNLTQDEVLGQLIGINDYLASKNQKPVTNIVFMGMGEALSNFDVFCSSLEIIRHEDAFFIGSRRITVSTAGVIPSIRKLIDLHLTIGLAISLNTYNNAKRDRIMPINKTYPIEQLVAIAGEYVAQTGRPVTFEYVLVKDENDSKEAVAALTALLHGLVCKVNVIPVNPGSSYGENKNPSDASAYRFAQDLCDAGVNAMVRKSRGKDIKGACGQLAASHINK